MSPPGPSRGPRAIVVVPARDEQHEIAVCLHALAAQTVGRDSFEVIVVADACADDTAGVAERAARDAGLTLSVHAGPGAGAGAARRLGMDLAAARLLDGLGRLDGVIACTDADSRPAPDWLERQLAHIDRGADAVAGMIELDADEAARLPAGVLRRRERDAARRLHRVRRIDPSASHHHFAGASIGITAERYRAVGGLPAQPALEDAALADRLIAHGVPIVRAADVVVRTSARDAGRAVRGLAVDLAVSKWSEDRRYRAADFPPARLRELKGRHTVTVIIPTKECAETIGRVLRETVGPLRAAGVVDEVVVIDADSADRTAAVAGGCGAKVLQQDEVLPDAGPARGKGDAMWRAVSVTESDIVCFLDGDTGDPHPHHLQGLIGPLLAHPELQLVKGAFERPLRAGEAALANEGGRVTELMARPLLNLHVPQLAGFAQPLAGEFAARRELLCAIPFPVGYGVEIAVLIDALRRHGLDALAESELGTRQNRHQSLRALGEMAYAVLAAVERRLDGRPSPLGGHYLRPWEDGTVALVEIEERPPVKSLPQARFACSASSWRASSETGPAPFPMPRPAATRAPSSSSTDAQ